MGYQNYCCQCNCLPPGYSQPKALVPFSPKFPSCCKCTSFMPRGRFPNDKVFFVCCQECVIKSPKDISRLYEVSSSSSTSTNDESPCCCYNQCPSCLMKQMVKQTLKKSKRKSREEHKSKKHHAKENGDSREQTSDYEFTDKAHYRKTRPHHKKGKEHRSEGDDTPKRGHKRYEEVSLSSDENEEIGRNRSLSPMPADTSVSEYTLPSKSRSNRRREDNHQHHRIQKYNERVQKSKENSRPSILQSRKASNGKSRHEALSKTRSSCSNKTKTSKNVSPKRNGKAQNKRTHRVQWGPGLYEPDPKNFGVMSYDREPCSTYKYEKPCAKVTKREPNSSDWMRIRLEKLDQCRSRCDRSAETCRKPCPPYQKCRPTSTCPPQPCLPCNYYLPGTQSTYQAPFVYAT